MKQLFLIIATLALFCSTAVLAQSNTTNATTPRNDITASNILKELDSITVPSTFNWEQYQVANLPIPVDNFSLSRPIPSSIPEAGVGIKAIRDLNNREKMILYGFSSETDSFTGISLLASAGYMKYFIAHNQEPSTFMELTGLQDLVNDQGRELIDKFNTEVAAGNPQPSLVGVISPINNRVPSLHQPKFTPGDMFFSRVAPEDFIEYIKTAPTTNKMLTIVGNFKSNSEFMPLPFLTSKPIFDKDTVVFYARVYGFDKVIAEIMLVHTEKWETAQ